MTERIHDDAKTSSQLTDSLQARLAMNRGGSNPVALHTWVARLLTEWLPGHARVLDIGCGTGMLGAALQGELAAAGKTFDAYIGIDPSDTHGPVFLAQAPPRSRFERVTLRRWLEEGSDGEAFDAIVCLFSLYYHETEDLDGLLGALLGRLPPSGRLVVCGPVEPNNRAWFETLRTKCGVEVPARMLYESYDYMQDVVAAASRAGVDFRAKRYRNSVTMTGTQVRDYWRSVIYHRTEHDAAVDRCFADGVTIDKEILYLELAGPGP